MKQNKKTKKKNLYQQHIYFFLNTTKQINNPPKTKKKTHKKTHKKKQPKKHKQTKNQQEDIEETEGTGCIKMFITAVVIQRSQFDVHIIDN